MKFMLLSLASANETWAAEAQKLYIKKLNHYIPFEVAKIKGKDASRRDKQRKVEAESKIILERLSNDDFVILFDEKGKSLDSIEFSKQIERVMSGGKKRIVFIIGGAFGVNESVLSRAQLTVSFSKMVFNHLVAETVALEQIYRAMTIIKNIPYHNI